MGKQRQHQQKLQTKLDSHEPDQTEAQLIAKAKGETGEKASDHTNDLLDEIDAALEGVEQDLGITFRQKGGQ